MDKKEFLAKTDEMSEKEKVEERRKGRYGPNRKERRVERKMYHNNRDGLNSVFLDGDGEEGR